MTTPSPSRVPPPPPGFQEKVDSLMAEHARLNLEPSYVRIKEDLEAGLGRALSPAEKDIVTENLDPPDRIRREVYVDALSALRSALRKPAGTHAWDKAKTQEAKTQEAKAWNDLWAYRNAMLLNAKGPAVSNEAKLVAIARAHALTDRLKLKREHVLEVGEPGYARRLQAAKAALKRQGTLTMKRGGRTRRGRKTRKTRKGRKGRKARTYKSIKGRKTRR